jgi:hypothetical protein
MQTQYYCYRYSINTTDFPVVNELSSARIWQHKLCATLSANININFCLPIKVYYCICTLRHIRIEIIHGSQNVFWVLTWVGEYLFLKGLFSNFVCPFVLFPLAYVLSVLRFTYSDYPFGIFKVRNIWINQNSLMI